MEWDYVDYIVVATERNYLTLHTTFHGLNFSLEISSLSDDAQFPVADVQELDGGLNIDVLLGKSKETATIRVNLYKKYEDQSREKLIYVKFQRWSGDSLVSSQFFHAFCEKLPPRHKKCCATAEERVNKEMSRDETNEDTVERACWWGGELDLEDFGDLLASDELHPEDLNPPLDNLCSGSPELVAEAVTVLAQLSSEEKNERVLENVLQERGDAVAALLENCGDFAVKAPLLTCGRSVLCRKVGGAEGEYLWEKLAQQAERNAEEALGRASTARIPAEADRFRNDARRWRARGAELERERVAKAAMPEVWEKEAQRAVVDAVMEQTWETPGPAGADAMEQAWKVRGPAGADAIKQASQARRRLAEVDAMEQGWGARHDPAKADTMEQIWDERQESLVADAAWEKAQKDAAEEKAQKDAAEKEDQEDAAEFEQIWKEFDERLAAQGLLDLSTDFDGDEPVSKVATEVAHPTVVPVLARHRQRDGPSMAAPPMSKL